MTDIKDLLEYAATADIRNDPLVIDLAEALARSEREIAAQVATIEAARTWARWPFEGNNKGSEPNWDALDCILAGKTTTTPYPTNA